MVFVIEKRRESRTSITELYVMLILKIIILPSEENVHMRMPNKIGILHTYFQWTIVKHFS